MRFEYHTEGTCSRNIILDMDGDTIENVQFIGGCNGNLKGISSLIVGGCHDDIARTFVVFGVLLNADSHDLVFAFTAVGRGDAYPFRCAFHGPVVGSLDMHLFFRSFVGNVQIGVR